MRTARRRPLDVARATKLYTRGLSTQHVADRLAHTRRYVCARLRRAGVIMRPAGRPPAIHAIDDERLRRLRDCGAT
jgi:hypothetical protein